MKTMKLLSGVCGIALALAACGSSGGGTSDDTMMTTDHAMADAKTQHKYVISNINIPDKASENDMLGFDLDNDSRHAIDNKLGAIIQLIASNAGSATVDLQGQVDTQVMMGKIILLGSLHSTGFATESNVLFQLFLGQSFTAPAVPDFTGAGTFMIDTAGPQDSKLYGNIAAGLFKSTELGTASIKLAIVQGGDPVNIHIIAARVQGTVAENGIMNAKIGGGITKMELQNNVLPLVFTLIQKQLTDMPTSSGSMALKQLFDTNKDGMITQAEFNSSNTIMTVLSPDVDLVQDSGLPNTFVYTKDGTKESVSLGMGFTAVKGTF